MSFIGGMAAALAAASGIAFASESGNAPQFSTKAPDPTSAQVVINGPDTPSGTPQAQFLLCFNKQIQTISTTGSQSILDAIRLVGYGADGSPFPGGDAADSPQQWVQLASGGTFSVGGTTGFSATAASNPSNPNCVNITITSPSGQPGVDLNGFSEVAVSENAATGLTTLGSTPGTVALTPSGTGEVKPLAGGSSGPKLVGASTSGLAPNQVGYLFSYNLDPNNVIAGSCGTATPGTNAAGGFAYVDSSGVEHSGCSASVSGNTVVVTFAGTIVNDRYYEVYGRLTGPPTNAAVYSQSQEVPNTTTAVGASVASIPTLRSVTKVSGVSGAYDLTYDQPVSDTVGGASLAAVLEDNTVIQAPANSVSRPSTDTRVIRVSFGSITNFSDYASKVVKIVDQGAEVFQQSAPHNGSALGEAAVSTPPNMMPGFTNGPNLIGFSIDKTNSTATYVFDPQGGALIRGGFPDITKFGLINADGSQIYGAGSAATYTGPNQVTVQYNPSQVANAVAGVVHKTGGGVVGFGIPNSDCAVADYEPQCNIGPEASGIGMGGYTTTGTGTSSSSTTSTTTTTSRTTVTSTTTSNRKSAKCPRGKHKSHGRCVKNKKKHKKCPKGKHRRGKKCVKNKRK